MLDESRRAGKIPPVSIEILLPTARSLAGTTKVMLETLLARGFSNIDPTEGPSIEVELMNADGDEWAKNVPEDVSPHDLGEQIKGLGAEVTNVENWGKRRLAYDIRKQREGTYGVLTVSAEPAMVKEFERQLRLNENVLRFLSTRVPIRKRARPAKPPQEVLEEVG